MRPKLTKISSDQVLEALNNHALWLSDQSQGAQANFAFCDLKDYDFSHKNLTKVIFTGANLSRAIFASCNLDEANLGGTIIKYGVFKDCSMRETNFTYAKIQYSKFENIEATNCYFGGADLTQADIWNSNFKDSCFDYSNCSGVNTVDSIFADCSFYCMNAELVLNFKNVAIIAANLTGVRYELATDSSLSLADCYVKIGEEKFMLVKSIPAVEFPPKEEETKKYFRYSVKLLPEDSRVGKPNTLLDCGQDKELALKWIIEHLHHLGAAAEGSYVEEREYVGIENYNKDFYLYSRPIWSAAFDGFDILEKMLEESHAPVK